MAEHKLGKGIGFIQFISELGKIMGYHIEVEVPVNTDNYISPVIDIAWFKEKNQKFPLFIFEVESKATNGMAYNPMKVFSKKNDQFEKPLFFFQIVLDGGQNSSRIDDLKEMFGSHNYRIYKISSQEGQKFIFDILEQHRRISHNIYNYDLFEYILKNNIINIDINKLAEHILNLSFEKGSGTLFPSFISLASSYSEIIPFVATCLKGIYINNSISLEAQYNTYIGNFYCDSIHLGIINCFHNDSELRAKTALSLVEWQKNGNHLSMIGPHFGLNIDYDQFIIWGAGGFIALLSLLFRENKSVRIFFAEELLKIIYKTNGIYKIPNIYWVLHIIPPTKEGQKLYDKVLTILHELGCFSLEHIWKPTFLEENIEFIEIVSNTHDKMPDYGEFLSLKELKGIKCSDNEIIQLACKILINQSIDNDLSAQLALYL